MLHLATALTVLFALGNAQALEFDSSKVDCPHVRFETTPSPITPVPDDWWTWRERDMYSYLDCEAIIEAGRPIHSNDVWVFLRKAYRGIVGTHNSTILPTDDVDGFDGIPIQAAVVPGKGRGLFATQDIKKGTRVWTSRHQCACFRDDNSFRRFLAAIPADLACDVLQWAYVEDMGKKGQADLRMCCDLDEGSFMNTKDSDDDANVGCVEENAKNFEGGCKENYFALRTIYAGEEILCDYNEFDAPRGWSRFGL